MMALHLFPASLHPISNPSSSSPSRSKQRHLLLQLSPPRLRSDRSQSGVTENDNDPSPSGKQSDLFCSSSSVRTQLDLLEQLTSTSDGYLSDGGGGFRGSTVREQLAGLVGDRDDDFTIPLGKNLKKVSPKFLTTSQKRNIKRQSYLNEVSQRNDSVFFATIGAFVILPPLLILGIAILTGYVQLFP
ncbi:hypothetical protein DY000_02035882 [Brassica cretica]|uniref:Uncharacterized protein n=1 Tax=Brassica cretica TaxID=69181 RepID=A0ABQ7DF84_BRACR|nr:hypothetical protein DY000_02035882 [Brassica cretica]